MKKLKLTGSYPNKKKLDDWNISSLMICICLFDCKLFAFEFVSTIFWLHKYQSCAYTFFVWISFLRPLLLFPEPFPCYFFSWWKYCTNCSFNLEIFMTFVYGLQETYIHRNRNWLFSLKFHWNIFCVYVYRNQEIDMIEIRMSQSFGTKRPNLNCIQFIGMQLMLSLNK